MKKIPDRKRRSDRELPAKAAFTAPSPWPVDERRLLKLRELRAEIAEKQSALGDIEAAGELEKAKAEIQDLSADALPLEAYKNRVRLECQTDLLYLGKILGYNKFVEELHRPAVEVLVKKNPALTIQEQSKLKLRIQLDPRKSYKSTLGMMDSVQWVICFPNIAVCKLGATKPLSVAIVGEITDHFVLMDKEKPTLFQLLFPEFCIAPHEKLSGKYTAPCRTVNRKEATIMAFSVETSMSGWHFDVFDPDDVVDATNSSSPAQIKKTKKIYYINKKTAMPWAYITYRGTRYDAFDLSADVIEKATPGKSKILVRGALSLKDGTRLEPGEFPPEKDMVLHFEPLGLTYDFLRDAFNEDYESFMTQYMNDAHGGHELTFSPELMLKAVADADLVPVTGELFIAWRPACGSKPNMAAAGAAVGLLANGRMYVVDALRGTFKPSVLAYKAVMLAKNHGVHRMTIEDTPGARANLDSAIRNYAVTVGWPVELEWLPFEEDDAARDMRIKGTEPLLVSGRLLISDGVRCLKDIHKQFVHYGAIEEMELPDVVARVAERLPKLITPINLAEEQKLAWDTMRARDMYDRTHGVGAYAPPEPLAAEAPGYKPPANDYGLDDMLGGLNG